MAVIARPTTARPDVSPWFGLRRRPELLTVPLVFLLIVGGWEAAVRHWQIDAFILPGPTAIARELMDGIAGGYFTSHTWVTATEMFLGFLIGAGLALAIGAVVSQFPLVEKTFFAYLVGLQTVPKLAIAPLIVVWFGFGMESKVFIAALIVFFPVVVNVIEGFRAMGATPWQLFAMVKVPNALPYIFVGLNIGVVMAILGAVVGEFVGAQEGLGYLILQYNYQLKIARVFAILIILAAIGITLHTAVKILHRRIVFWRKPDHKIEA
jgi:NitT/TauT family transport system permease protein